MAKDKIAYQQAYWRESARPLKIFGMSAHVGILILLFVMHIQWWTFFALIGAIAFLKGAEHFGYTPQVAILAIRSFVAGRKVSRRRAVGGRFLSSK